MQVRLATLVLAAAAALAASEALAQNRIFDPGPAGANAQANSQPAEYGTAIGKLTPIEMIQAKAQIKAAQRSAVLASRQWYGYSQSRPKTTATPFSGLYGQQYQGYAFGRPAAHYATRPIIVVTR